MSMDQNLLTEQKESTTDTLTTASNRGTQRTTEETGDLWGNKIAEKIRKAATKNTHEDPKNYNNTTTYKST